MASQKPSIPKGTRDFGVTEMVRRNFIFDSIRKVFQLYGYKPIETPAMENLSTLLGKYGDEGDRLIFKILNSGDYLSEITDKKIDELTSNELTKHISEKALRYDLTVPFARFVVMHQNEITFPFKRYQIQPVWRADRPQKGRYREFYQCDVDVIGSDSLLNEVELIQLTIDIFKKLNIPVKIKINNRKILFGIAEHFNVQEKFLDIASAIDKLDKVNVEKVIEELEGKKVSRLISLEIMSYLGYGREEYPYNNISEKNFLDNWSEKFKPDSVGMKGVKELKEVFSYFNKEEENIEFDVTLARGLNYYTGAIFEVKAKDASMGSIAGGGRYDDLTGIFGLPNVSGVGISFGADRIYDVLNELKLFPEDVSSTTKVLFVNFGSIEEKYCLPLVEQLRKSGISAEIYPSAAKLKKQLDYANANHIPLVVIAGEDEISSASVTLKNMNSGQQLKLNAADLINSINSAF